jgi:GT2 family glycosyltransferase
VNNVRPMSQAASQPINQSTSPPSASVVIPNWNGEAFLLRCVSSALQAVREHRRATGQGAEVLVVDDASTDRSVELVQRDCPGARLVRRAVNGGFAEAVNEGAREARGEILVLLNSDMAVRPDFLTRLLAPLADPAVFAVSAKTLEWSGGTPNHLNMTARLERGQITLEYSDPPERCDTLFLNGGAAALRREVFLAAGGFPALYRPGYWEDYDLSLRAVKAGWRIVFEPRALAHHLGKASLTARLGDDALRRVIDRNRLLFTWALLTDSAAWWRHWIGLPGWVARQMRRGDGASRLRAFLAALRRLPEVMALRRRIPSPRAVSDEEALSSTRPPQSASVQTVPGEL